MTQLEAIDHTFDKIDTALGALTVQRREGKPLARLLPVNCPRVKSALSALLAAASEVTEDHSPARISGGTISVTS